MAENKNEMKDSYTAYDSGQIGTVQIADEVVAIIAGPIRYLLKASNPWRAISPMNWWVSWG